MQDKANRWLRQAEDDQVTAKLLLEQGRYNACAFHCHQAAEKALKALLYAAGDRPWGHVLPSLLERAESQGIVESDAGVTRAVNELDKHYTSTRYPDAFEAVIPAEYYEIGMAEETVEWMEVILQFVRQRLP